ncbi:MAG: hypothetical protein HUJ75_03395 [Parasporobacterium sp.]|nr:hypothetical protein [Parasporobacterium sp.]
MRSTQYSRRYNERVLDIYVDGSVVRKQEVRQPVPFVCAPAGAEEVAPIVIHKRPKVRPSEKAAAKKKSIPFAATLGFLLIVAAALAMIFMILTLSVQNNQLNRDINSLEAQIEELSARNDSKEYDMNSSVDLNEVIKIATEELGMQRANPSQIRTYSSSSSEYVKQIAEIPAE